MSMLRYLRDTGDDRPVTPIYGNKTARDIIFASELEQMPDHVRVVHVLSRADAGWTGLTGHITRTIIEESAGEHLQTCHVFVCGPVAMMNAVLRELKAAHVDRRNPLRAIHHLDGRPGASSLTRDQDSPGSLSAAPICG